MRKILVILLILLLPLAGWGLNPRDYVFKNVINEKYENKNFSNDFFLKKLNPRYSTGIPCIMPFNYYFQAFSMAFTAPSANNGDVFLYNSNTNLPYYRDVYQVFGDMSKTYLEKMGNGWIRSFFKKIYFLKENSLVSSSFLLGIYVESKTQGEIYNSCKMFEEDGSRYIGERYKIEIYDQKLKISIEFKGGNSENVLIKSRIYNLKKGFHVLCFRNFYMGSSDFQLYDFYYDKDMTESLYVSPLVPEDAIDNYLINNYVGDESFDFGGVTQNGSFVTFQEILLGKIDVINNDFVYTPDFEGKIFCIGTSISGSYFKEVFLNIIAFYYPYINDYIIDASKYNFGCSLTTDDGVNIPGESVGTGLIYSNYSHLRSYFQFRFNTSNIINYNIVRIKMKNFKNYCPPFRIMYKPNYNVLGEYLDSDIYQFATNNIIGKLSLSEFLFEKVEPLPGNPYPGGIGISIVVFLDWYTNDNNLEVDSLLTFDCYY